VVLHFRHSVLPSVLSHLQLVCAGAYQTSVECFLASVPRTFLHYRYNYTSFNHTKL